MSPQRPTCSPLAPCACSGNGLAVGVPAQALGIDDAHVVGQVGSRREGQKHRRSDGDASPPPTSAPLPALEVGPSGEPLCGSGPCLLLPPAAGPRSPSVSCGSVSGGTISGGSIAGSVTGSVACRSTAASGNAATPASRKAPPLAPNAYGDDGLVVGVPAQSAGLHDARAVVQACPRQGGQEHNCGSGDVLAPPRFSPGSALSPTA